MDFLGELKNCTAIEKENCIEITTVNGQKKQYYIGDCLIFPVFENGEIVKKSKITLIEI